MAFAWVEHPQKILKWGLIDCGEHNARRATANLIQLLEGEHRWMRESGDDVVVELQPSNGVIKVMSHVLQAYFATVAPQCAFDFMRPNDKLKFVEEIYNDVKPTSGADRKVVTMQTTENVILPAQGPNSNSFAAYYYAEKHKQRTDLADAVVQACRWLQLRTAPKKRSRANAFEHKPSMYGGGDFDLQSATRQDERLDSSEIDFVE